MIVKCAVACFNASGEPDFFYCDIECSNEEYDVGEHYELAEEAAEGEGYSGPMVSFDENDGPAFLFEPSVYSSAGLWSTEDE